VSIPEREMIVWRDPELARAIREGLAEAERGETANLGSFAGYADDEDTDEE
jgi:PHD/YefM family antitoxin component YafN of YafNO toxin-antitoxin module